MHHSKAVSSLKFGRFKYSYSAIHFIMTDLSIVIPAYNEEGNVAELYRQIIESCKRIKESFEIIFIDDGSIDGTFAELKRIHSKDKKVKVISFQRNFHKAAALMAGFKASKGAFILTMDADLQDDPSEIPNFFRAMKENSKLDLIVGWKYFRKDSWHKRFASKIFNFFVRKLTNIKVHDADCNFRLMKKKLVDSLDVYGGLYRYIPSIAHSLGFGVGEIKVVHHPRFSGKSKFGIGRLIKGALDLLTIKFLITYRRSPLYFFGSIGLILSGAGSIAAIYLAYIRLFLGQEIGQRPLLLLSALLIIVGIQFLSLGLIAELVQADSQKKSTQYIIKTVLE